MNITVLYHIEPDDPDPDDVVGQVAKALKQSKHRVSILGVYDDISKLKSGLSRRKPDLIFNLMETFGDTELGAVAVTGLLELLGIPYTGGGPGELYLQEDKGLTKKLLAYDEVLYPDFAIFTEDTGLETGGSLRMPLIVKPLRMDASIGIEGGALVRSTTEMMERVLNIHTKVRDAALAEEYIEGREFHVGIIGNGNPQAFPPIEMDFSGLPPDRPRILDARAKWDEKSVEYKTIRSVIAALSEELRARLERTALDAYRALRVRDYGRVDLRLTRDGDVYVIEVNASCYLEEHSELAMSAAAGGVDYVELVNRIADMALERHKAKQKNR
jgi:D-alanine-D-alanine ligase